MTMMKVQRLHELFDAHPEKNELGFEGSCHDCGRAVRVGVALTGEGFAISGGAVYEPEPGRFHQKCEECFRKEPHLSNFRRCEVYSRVVGYLRPVSQWNEGKQAEFSQRKAYSLPAR
jgi:hypothetical protein